MPPAGDDGARTPGRRAIDWEAIEKDFRTGTFSTRQLGTTHGCDEALIRRKAKAEGWQKDLAPAVRKATEEGLIRADVRVRNVRDDAETVAEAAGTRIGTVLSHRASVARDTKRLEVLAAKLDALLPEVETIMQIGAAQDILESMARTRAKLIPLERQAFSLDDKAPAEQDTRTPEQIKAALSAKLAVLGLTE